MPARKDYTSEDTTVITPRFRIVFFSVLGLTLILFLVDVLLVLNLPHPDQQAQSLMDLCSRTSTIGFGAIIGLLGGKAVLALDLPADMPDNMQDSLLSGIMQSDLPDPNMGERQADLQARPEAR